MQVAYEYNSLASLYYEIEEENKVVECLSKALKIKEVVSEKVDRELAQWYSNLAAWYGKFKMQREELKFLEKSLNLYEFIVREVDDDLLIGKMEEVRGLLIQCQINQECNKVKFCCNI